MCNELSLFMYNKSKEGNNVMRSLFRTCVRVCVCVCFESLTVLQTVCRVSGRKKSVGPYVLRTLVSYWLHGVSGA